MTILKTFFLLFLPALGILANPLSPKLQLENFPDFSFLHNLECGTCKFLVGMLQQAAETPSPAQDSIAAAVVKFCETFQIEDSSVCQGIVSEYKDILLYVFAETVLQPDCICQKIANCPGNCKDGMAPWNVTFPDVPKPPVKPLQRPPANAATLKILHLSDLHYDSRYTVGSESNCDEPLCCRFFGQHDDGTNNPIKVPAGHWGTVAKCDSPLWTLELLFKHLNKTSDQFDFVYWTGDLPPHNLWNQTQEDQLEVLEVIVGLFKKYLPNKPIYPALGNHESAPANNFAPHFSDLPEQYSIDWLYFALADEWADWINDPQNVATVRQIGSYVAKVRPGLRVISLNVNYCYNENYYLFINSKDPDGALQWLISQLQDAENAGDSVHIIGHIPPGLNNCLKWWSWNYHKIVERYESTIRGQFFGHTHNDHFLMMYENANVNGRPVGTMLICPSITPYADSTVPHNPAYKIFTIDGRRRGSNWAPLGHRAYFLDLEEANALPENQEPEWKIEYDTAITYNMKGGFPADYQKLFEQLQTDRYLNEYVKYRVSRPELNQCCNARCKRDHLCEILSGRSHDPNLCAGL